MKKVFKPLLAVLLGLCMFVVPAYSQTVISTIGDKNSSNVYRARVERDSSGSQFIFAQDTGIVYPYQTASSTDDTVTKYDSGTVFTASASLTYTLPGAAVGLRYTFVDGAGATINIDPASGDVIKFLTLAAGDKLTSPGTTGDSVTLYSVDTTNWYVADMRGNWTDGN